MNKKNFAVVCAALSAACMISVMPLEVYGETTELQLPSAGVQYVLSSRRVSLRDVARTVNSENIIRKEKQQKVLGAALLEAAKKGFSGEKEIREEEILESAMTEVQSQTGGNAENEPVSIPEETKTAEDGKKDAEKKEVSGSVIEEIPPEPESIPEEEEAAEGNTEQDADREESQAETESVSAEDKLAVALVSDYVNIRKEPTTESEYVGKLYANGVGTIQGENVDGWVLLSSGGVTGYVRAEYLAVGEYAKELAQNVANKMARVKTETLRVRAAADIESDVITLIPGGEEFKILEELDGWVKVDTPDGEGYISSDYADVEMEYPEAESREAEQARLAEEQRKAEEAARKAASGKGKKSGKTAQAAVTYAASGSGTGADVANFALQFQGNPYVWGGSSLTNGADCSGFVMAVYKNFGVNLPHNDAADRSVGTAVSDLSQAAAGDIVCYDGHVGIYIGNGQIVHASNPRSGIKVSNASYRSILTIRRIF